MEEACSTAWPLELPVSQSTHTCRKFTLLPPWLPFVVSSTNHSEMHISKMIAFLLHLLHLSPSVLSNISFYLCVCRGNQPVRGSKGTVRGQTSVWICDANDSRPWCMCVRLVFLRLYDWKCSRECVFVSKYPLLVAVTYPTASQPVIVSVPLCSQQNTFYTVHAIP